MYDPDNYKESSYYEYEYSTEETDESCEEISESEIPKPE